MARLHWRDFQDAVMNYFENECGVSLQSEVQVHLPDGQSHRFDLASVSRSVLVECKSYTFTVSGNEPSAKLNNARGDALLLRATNAKRKLIVFDDDVIPGKGSLAELFERRNRGWLADVEVWRHVGGLFTKVS